MGSRGLAAIATSSLLAGPACRAPTPTAGFWYEDRPFALPAHAAEKLGGPLTEGELETIKHRSREELQRAFAGMRIRITDDPGAFWRVEVDRSLRERGPLPNAGESLSFGWPHNKDDENSDEYPSPDRASQYFGELHWTTARPLLEQKLR